MRYISIILMLVCVPAASTGPTVYKCDEGGKITYQGTACNGNAPSQRETNVLVQQAIWQAQHECTQKQGLSSTDRQCTLKHTENILGGGAVCTDSEGILSCMRYPHDGNKAAP